MRFSLKNNEILIPILFTLFTPIYRLEIIQGENIIKINFFIHYFINIQFTGFGGRAISIGTNHISYHIYNISFVHTCIEPNIQLGSPTTVTHIRS